MLSKTYITLSFLLLLILTGCAVGAKLKKADTSFEVKTFNDIERWYVPVKFDTGKLFTMKPKDKARFVGKKSDTGIEYRLVWHFSQSDDFKIKEKSNKTVLNLIKVRAYYNKDGQSKVCKFERKFDKKFQKNVKKLTEKQKAVDSWFVWDSDKNYYKYIAGPQTIYIIPEDLEKPCADLNLKYASLKLKKATDAKIVPISKDKEIQFQGKFFGVVIGTITFSLLTTDIDSEISFTSKSTFQKNKEEVKVVTDEETQEASDDAGNANKDKSKQKEPETTTDKIINFIKIW